MERLKKPTTVASANRSQEKRVLPRVPPSQEQHLQANASCLKQSAMGSDNGLLPGLKGNGHSNLRRAKLPPLIKWKCPPRLNRIMSDWRVAAGEESSEIQVQKQRELRVLEAFYPRPSDIPPNPASSVDNLIGNDQNALPVPIVPIEGKNVVQKGGPVTSVSANNNAKESHSSDPLAFFKSATPDIVDAAQGAVSAIMQVAVSTVMSILGSRNHIDRDLLVQILGDPKMVQQLLTSQSPSPTTQDEPFTSFLSMITSMHNVQSSSSPARPATGMTDCQISIQNMKERKKDLIE